MRILPLIEDVARLIEPWVGDAEVDNHGSRSVASSSGTIVDLNMRRPANYEADHLYAWPSRHDHALAGVGAPAEERDNFAIQFVYAVEADDEEAQWQPSREVSDELDERAELYAGRIAANRSRYADRTAAPWEHLASSVQHDTTITFGVRGIGLLVTGYRIARYAS